MREASDENIGEVESPSSVSHWGVMEPGFRPEAELEAKSLVSLVFCFFFLSHDLQGLSLSLRVHFPQLKVLSSVCVGTKVSP